LLYLVNCISWAPWQYGLILLAGSSDGQISVISYAQDKWNFIQFLAHKSGVTCGSWAPAIAIENEENKNEELIPMRFVSGGCDGLVKMWVYNNETKKYQEETIASYTGWIKDVAFAYCDANWLSLPNSYFSEAELSDTLAVCAEGKNISVLRKREGKWVETKFKDQVSQAVKLSWSVNGHSLAVAYIDGKTQIFEENSEGNWVCSAEDDPEDPKQSLVEL
jgi:protein transport protein SEC13